MFDWDKIDDYCGTGVVTLIVLSVISVIVWFIPTSFWIIVGVIGVGVFILTLVCYALGRVVHFFMDKLGE
jgi:uncharacterized membrane protein